MCEWECFMKGVEGARTIKKTCYGNVTDSLVCVPCWCGPSCLLGSHANEKLGWGAPDSLE